MADVRVRVFGKFQVTNDSGALVSFRTSRAAEVVALLAMQPSRPLDRRHLADSIFPDLLSSEQLKSLRPALHYAKSALGEAIRVDERTNEVSLNAESDWKEAKRLELRIAAEVDPADRLMLSYTLAELIRELIFDKWDRLWTEPYRLRQVSMLTRVHTGLAEILGSRGEVETALKHIQLATTASPYDHGAVKLQLQLLGRLDRLAEAKQVYHDFKAVAGESGSSDVAAVAAKALSRGYSEKRTRLASSVQLEFVQDLLEMLAKEAPERLLPLLAAKQVNWAVVTHGNELKSLLELVLSRTNGWAPDRADVAKRLLQFYHQEWEFQHIRTLASQLIESPRPIDQVAAMNYLAMEATGSGRLAESVEHYSQALAICEREEFDYLRAVSRANLAFTEFSFLNFDAAKDNVSLAMDNMRAESEPNARFSFAHCLALQIQIHDLNGDRERAFELAEEWLKVAELEDSVRKDSTGFAIASLAFVRMGSPLASSLAIRAIDMALLSRQKGMMFPTALLVSATLRHIGLVDVAIQSARALLAWVTLYRTHLSPLEVRMFSEAGLVVEADPTEPPPSLAKVLVDLRETLELSPTKMGP